MPDPIQITIDTAPVEISLAVVGAGSVGLANPMDSAGDLIIGGVSGTPTPLPISTARKVLVSSGTAPEWSSFTVPASQGTSGHPLLTNGSGSWSFAALPLASLATGTYANKPILWDGATWVNAAMSHVQLTDLGNDAHTQYVHLSPSTTTRNYLQAQADVVGLRITGYASNQTANLQEWVSASGAVVAAAKNDGLYIVNPGTGNLAGIDYGPALFPSTDDRNVIDASTQNDIIPLTVIGSVPFANNFQPHFQVKDGNSLRVFAVSSDTVFGFGTVGIFGNNALAFYGAENGSSNATPSYIIGGPSPSSVPGNYYDGGSLSFSGGTGGAGGTIDVSGGSNGPGGSISTSDNGGSIVTGGAFGSIELGEPLTRTTLSGSGSVCSISLPPASGTLLLSTLATGKVFVGSNSGVATAQTVSGDATLTASGVLTLSTVNTQIGEFPVVTVNGKGLVTNARALASGDIPNLATTKITSGTFDTARLGSGTATAANFLRGNSTWSAISSGDLPSHNHAASDITSGTIPTARLGSGTADSTVFLRGDQTWAATPSGFSNPMTTAGDLIVGGSGGAATRLAAGSNTHVLTLVGGSPAWAAPSSGFSNPMTTAGDLILATSGGTATRLGIGSTGTFLRSDGSTASWSNLSIRSTGAAFDLTLASSEALTAGRTLSINVGDAARTLTISGNATISGTNTGDQTSVTGNAGTATALQTARNINGVSFNGTTDITVTAAAGTLTGSTLAAGVTGSSLTSLGTIGTGVWQGTTIGLAYGGTNANLSATGGTGHVLKQSAVGGNVTVAALVANDIPLLDAAKVTTGVFSTARLGTGTPGSSSFLKNGAWATIATSDLPAIDADSITIGQLSVTSGGTGSDLSATGGAGHVLKQSVVGDPVTVAALVASDIPNLDAAKITTGSISVARGGTGASLSATGGTGHVLKQSTVGGNVTVAALVANDIPNLDAGKITTGTVATDRLGSGTANSGTFLRGDQTWAAVPSGFSNPMTTAGDLILATSGGTATRLGIGAANSVLKSNGTTAAWNTVAHSELTGLTTGNPHTQYLWNAPSDGSTQNIINPALGNHRDVLIIQQGDSSTIAGTSTDDPYFGVWKDGGTVPAWMLFCNDGAFQQVRQSVPLRIYNAAGTFYSEVSIGTLAGNTTFRLPTSNGSSSQFLQTNGSGVTSWASLVASDIPSLDASKITTGTVSTARLGSGTANNSTYLRGDNTWGAPPVTQSLTATVDFGASFTDKASVVVTGQTWVTGTSRIVIQPVIPASVDPDEFRLLDFRVFVSDIVVGVGFTITVYTETEAKGQYDFNCVGV